MSRSAAELSATETLRQELDRSEDLAVLRRLWSEARAQIDMHAGPDRRPELRRLQRLAAEQHVREGVVVSRTEELVPHRTGDQRSEGELGEGA
jgi:hypothetical protein